MDLRTRRDQRLVIVCLAGLFVGGCGGEDLVVSVNRLMEAGKYAEAGSKLESGVPALLRKGSFKKIEELDSMMSRRLESAPREAARSALDGVCATASVKNVFLDQGSGRDTNDAKNLAEAMDNLCKLRP